MAKLVTIRLLTTGPNKNFKKGQVIEVDELRAAALISEKDAEEVKDFGDTSLQELQGIRGPV